MPLGCSLRLITAMITPQASEVAFVWRNRVPHQVELCRSSLVPVDATTEQIIRSCADLFLLLGTSCISNIIMINHKSHNDRVPSAWGGTPPDPTPGSETRVENLTNPLPPKYLIRPLTRDFLCDAMSNQRNFRLQLGPRPDSDFVSIVHILYRYCKGVHD
jgi:hypothetical protein